MVYDWIFKYNPTECLKSKSNVKLKFSLGLSKANGACMLTIFTFKSTVIYF